MIQKLAIEIDAEAQTVFISSADGGCEYETETGTPQEIAEALADYLKMYDK